MTPKIRPAKVLDIYRRDGGWNAPFICDDSGSRPYAVAYAAPKKGDWFLKPIGVRGYFRLIKSDRDYPFKQEYYILWRAGERNE